MRYPSAVVMMLATTVALAAEPPAFKSNEDKASYAIGLQIARNMKAQGVPLNVDAFSQGFKAGYADGKPLLSDEELQQTLQEFQMAMMAKQQQAMAAEGAKNREAGKAFLAANKAKQGVVELPSGLQYKVIKAGTGKKPTADSTVRVHYRGTLLDGTEFDSSYKRGEPAEFPLGGVIKGWTEALQLMQEGAKWELYIPASLAYGDQGAGGVIKPGSTLIFEVELLEVK
ncbi:MAG: FKBP-type peptidyl-prolyl cis-trans isomerase [Acidobacteriota bacterium]